MLQNSWLSRYLQLGLDFISRRRCSEQTGIEKSVCKKEKVIPLRPRRLRTSSAREAPWGAQRVFSFVLDPERVLIELSNSPPRPIKPPPELAFPSITTCVQQEIVKSPHCCCCTLTLLVPDEGFSLGRAAAVTARVKRPAKANIILMVGLERKWKRDMRNGETMRLGSIRKKDKSTRCLSTFIYSTK